MPDWTLRVAIGSALALAAGGCARPAQGGAGAESPKAAEAPGSQTPPPGCKMKVTPEETTLLCFPQQFAIHLPSDGWSFARSKIGPTLQGSLMTAGGKFMVSVVQLPKPEDYQTEVVLEQRYREAQSRSEGSGLSLNSPVMKAGRRSGRMMMTCEVVGAELAKAGARSQHVWTVAQAVDSSVLLYHVNWTGPIARWSEPVANTLAIMADQFYVVDDRGQELKP